jgi:hypothetical protein
MTGRLGRRRDLWNTLWSLAVGHRSLAVLLVCLLLCLLVLLLLPQAPSDPVKSDLWLLQMQARMGRSATALSALGLFTLGRSPLFRVLLAAFSFVVIARLVWRVELLLASRRPVVGGDTDWSSTGAGELDGVAAGLRRRGFRIRSVSDDGQFQADRWPWAALLEVLVYAGLLVLLVGLFVGQLWGWRAENLLGQPGEEVAVPGYGEVLIGVMTGGRARTISGVTLYLEGEGPQLNVVGIADSGNALNLQLGPGLEPSSQLRIRLTPAEAEAFFALPEVGLIVRIAGDPETLLQAPAPLRVQVYRSPSGELVQEVDSIGSTELTERGTRIRLERDSYLVLTAARDPGYWLKVVGLVVVGLSLAGQALYPERRLWIRQEDGQLMGAGDTAVLRRGASSTGQLARNLLPALPRLLAPAVVSAALLSLARSGLLWGGSAAQAGWTAIWLAGLVLGLLLRREGAGAGSEKTERSSGREA